MYYKVFFKTWLTSLTRQIAPVNVDIFEKSENVFFFWHTFCNYIPFVDGTTLSIRHIFVPCSSWMIGDNSLEFPILVLNDGDHHGLQDFHHNLVIQIQDDSYDFQEDRKVFSRQRLTSKWLYLKWQRERIFQVIDSNIASTEDLCSFTELKK